jgi:hypothetical protein
MNRNTKRGPQNQVPDNSLNLFTYDIFYGLEFFDTQETLSGAKKTITCPPDVTIKDNEIYFDYSSCNDQDYQYIKTIFKDIAKNSSFTVSDAIYRDQYLGVDDINLSATYTFVDFFEDKKIIKADVPTSLSPSDRINNYKKDNFVYVPQISVSSLANKTPKFGVVNYIGKNSVNSFTQLYAEPGQRVEFIGTLNNNKLFEISSFYTDNEEREILIFKENTIAENALDIPVIVKMYDNEEHRSHYRDPRPGSGVIVTPGVGTGSTGATCDCPPVVIDPPVVLPDVEPGASGGLEERLDWWVREFNCCKCLVYGEATCKKTCQECIAWVLRNRRKDPIPGGAIPNNERTMCEQAVDSGGFEGGCNGGNNCKFKTCFCDEMIVPPNCSGPTADPDNILERRCLNGAENACWKPYQAVTGGTTLEMEKERDKLDPTKGAQYFYACHLNNNPPKRSFAHDMACNIEAGICSKVTTGVCAKCPTCFYKCKSQPQPCAELRRRGLISRIPSSSEARSAHEDALDVSEISDELTIPGGFEPIVPVMDYMESLGYDGTIESITTLPSMPFQGPYAIDGYYPLYVSPEAAVAASPTPNVKRAGESTVGYHVHIIQNIKYYMPNGLMMNVTQFHGNYTGSGGVVQTQRTTTYSTPTQQESTPIPENTQSVPTTGIPESPPITPVAPTTPPPSSGGGGGGGY